MVVFLALLNFTQSKNNTPQINSTHNTYSEPHKGFLQHEDLARAYVEYMLYDDAENLIGAMSKDMIADIAVENFTSYDTVERALSAWYSREISYIKNEFPQINAWRISEIHWCEEEELEDLDYGLGIAGYDYTGLRNLGTTNVIYYGASISFINYAGQNDGFSLHFAVAEIDNLWYLVGID